MNYDRIFEIQFLNLFWEEDVHLIDESFKKKFSWHNLRAVGYIPLYGIFGLF
jgi:hypothetical protein